MKPHSVGAKKNTFLSRRLHNTENGRRKTTFHFVKMLWFLVLVTCTYLYFNFGFDRYFDLCEGRLNFWSNLSVVRLDSGLFEISAETQDIHVVFVFLCQHQGENMKEILSNIMIFLQEQHQTCQTRFSYCGFFLNIEIFPANTEIFSFLCCWFSYWTDTNRALVQCHSL